MKDVLEVEEVELQGITGTLHKNLKGGDLAVANNDESAITLPYRFTPREYQYPFLRYFEVVPARQRAFLLAHR